MTRIALCGVLAAMLAFPAVSTAGKPDKAKHKQKQKKEDHRAADEVRITVTFASRERDAVRGYFVESHGRGKCPPGLAKKNNGCLPPGQAKRRYVVGRPLPHGIIVEELPRELLVRIGPAPHGYRYAIVDGDLVKLAIGTMLVVDAIEGLVH